MDRDAAITRLKEHEAELRRLGVQSLYLFGSAARNEAGPDSDVDLFFDHQFGTLSLFDIMHIKEAAADILGAKADVIPRRGLHHLIRSQVEASAIQVF